MLSQFEYITVLFSFVAAFGVSQLLAGWGRQYVNRGQARPDVLQSLASLLILLALLQSVWGSWNFRGVSWSFGGFLLALAPFLPLAVAAALVHPPASAPPSLSLRDHYFSVYRAAFLLMASWVLLGVLAEVVLLEAAPQVGQWVRAAGVAILIAMAWSRRPALHADGLVCLGLLQAAFIATVTPELQ